MYDELTGPPKEWDIDEIIQCPNCGAPEQRTFIDKKTDKRVCGECWYKDWSEKFIKEKDYDV